MEYSIKQLAQLAGVSARTLRYYDEIHLLKPLYVNEAGYRFYGEEQLNLLQQILFYRERGLPLQQIAAVLYDGQFDILAALEEHLLELKKRQQQTNQLIATVQKTIAAMKGEYEMQDTEKFEAFKQNLVQQHEEQYGAELRQNYGGEEVDASQRKILNMTEGDYERFKNLAAEIQRQLETAVKTNQPSNSEAARAIVMLHKEWLGMTWKCYTAEAHQGVAQMYIADERFQQYYDRKVKGCAAFLEQAVRYWTTQKL